MESIVRFSLKQKVFFNLLFVFLIVAGFFAINALPVERYPNVNFGEVVISTAYPGASPSDVEALVTRKLEESIESIESIEWIKSTSYPERSQIKLKFIDDTDYKHLYNEVRLKVLNTINELPAEVDPPTLENFTVNDFYPVVTINISGSQNNRALTLIAKEIKTHLQKLPGINKIQLEGEYTREFHIFLDPKKLRHFGISYNEVAQALKEINISIPAGSVNTPHGNYLVKVDETFNSRTKVIRSIIRKDGDSGFIRLEDLISDAQLGYRDPTIISSVNGKNVIALKIIKNNTGNALSIKEDIQATLKSLQPLLAQEQLHIELTQDSTIKINDGISTLGLNMLMGMILVSLIIWYFMGIRNSGLITIGIPFSFMITLLLMFLTGNSLNEMTLFSFVLVTGIIVDDAIVVTENIYRHIQEGKSLDQAVITGTSEIALPVIASTLTTIAAFLPMLLMSGPTGEFFAQIPTAVTYALIASLIECLIILPIHYFDYGPRHNNELSARLEKDDFILSSIRTLTEHTLSLTLKYRRSCLALVGALLILSIGILGVSISGKLPLVKIQFFPNDYSVYFVNIKAKPEVSIEEVDIKVREISQFILNDGPEKVMSAAGFAGYYVGDNYFPIFSKNYGNVMVTLPEKEKRSFTDPMQHLENMRSRLKKQFEHNGYQIRVQAQKEGPVTGKDISVRILGSNEVSITGLAQELDSFLKSTPSITPHLVDLKSDKGQLKRVIGFEIDHEKTSEYQLKNSLVTQLAGSVLDGQYIGTYRLNNEEIDLKLAIDPKNITSLAKVLEIPFIENSTGAILLGDIAKLHTYSEPGELHRYDSQRSIGFTADIKPDAPTNAAVVLGEIQTFYQQVRSNYPGANLIIAGDHASTQKSYSSLAFAFVISILVIYLILAAQFQSYLQPAIILSAIIFALIGVILGKFLTQSIFTINSFLAIIGVAGVVVNDSLMLVDFMNKGYRAGLSRRAAIEEGIRVRLRPIVLTTLTTTLGLLPMAIGIPEYSLVWGSMASTFVTGLITATLLTLFIVPVLWDMLQEEQDT
ncbi:MAG: AcrB/AcrD/AcrF family protein [Methyloprofundus sp.]|nr:AcrB/AcrD/AcrF family protein [Methyloprofundus sp.]